MNKIFVIGFPKSRTSSIQTSLIQTIEELFMTFKEFIKKVEDAFMSNQPPKVRAINRWRYGQTLMNVLWDVWPEKYNEIKDSDINCFYSNRTVNMAINKLEKEWDDKS